MHCNFERKKKKKKKKEFLHTLIKVILFDEYFNKDIAKSFILLIQFK
jgi:hypothetical protein